MTYKQLQSKLQRLDANQLDQDVTIYVNEDAFTGIGFYYQEYQDGDDILDNGHPYFIVKI